MAKTNGTFVLYTLYKVVGRNHESTKKESSYPIYLFLDINVLKNQHPL